MTAETLLERTARDTAGRLRWRVMGELGICPASLTGRLLSRRRAILLACHLILDAGARTGAAVGTNPNFDPERYRRLAGGGTA